jgi:uncharacterized protein
MTTRIAFAFALMTAGCAGVDAGPIDDSSDPYTEAGDKTDAFRLGKFETFTGQDGRTYFHLLAGNGEKVLASQGYASLRNAQDGIATVRFNGEHTESYQLLQAADGQWYFNLLAGNYQVIGTSELYTTKSNAQRAISTVAGIVQAANQAASQTGARFQVFHGLDGAYYFHLRAANGEIVLQSQGYTRRSSAVSGTASVSANGTVASHYQIKDAANGQAYFVLVAGNGQVVGVSETYFSRSNAERGAQTVQALLTSGATITPAQ